jgi:hypothetical protein
MRAYWDASAVLALIFIEADSKGACSARDQTREVYAWSWMQVELATGLSRRGASPSQADALTRFTERVFWLDLPATDFPAMAKANETWRLRSADAGHLYCFQQAAQILPDLHLVCFDRELSAAARAEKLRVWKP